MTRRARLILFVFGACGFALLLAAALLSVPGFGTAQHRYAERAVLAAQVQRHTANAVASVTFDQRGLDTLAETFMFVAAVLGIAALLRRNPDEEEIPPRAHRQERRPPVPNTLRLAAYLLLPVTILVGIYIVLHGHISPGGGFQGGVVLGTAIHLLYLAGDFPTLARLRPVPVFEATEAVAAGAFVLLGFGAMLTGAVFLTNVMPYGTQGELLSAGTVPLLNILVGIEVAAGVVLLIAQFLEQALLLRRETARK
ncbi:MAG TPA: MnhB domain-containing protein [Salinisphaeraceae bacterium]|nr:MnhB domain-containing protein [Salinisphaeraceae bacterium]